MPNWGDVLSQIQGLEAEGLAALDIVRRRYLKQLSDYTGRNVIAYYSGWLQNAGSLKSSIRDEDKNGFMNAVHQLDRVKGLDLLIHSPGGDLAATESIVDYLHRMFNKDIRAFIPQLAMSGGTMMACACKVIWMGKQSNIGPIDPQFNGIPAHGVLQEFKKAIEETKADPRSIPMWQQIISRYHPTFIGECEKAIQLADEICTKWLAENMSSRCADAKTRAAAVVKKLNNHDDTKTHARHIHIDEAEEFGLEIKRLEEDPKLQDLVLTIHHAFMHTFSRSGVVKGIENHEGKAVFIRDTAARP
jgi:hypothetical protein